MIWLLKHEILWVTLSFVLGLVVTWVLATGTATRQRPVRRQAPIPAETLAARGLAPAAPGQRESMMRSLEATRRVGSPNPGAHNPDVTPVPLLIDDEIEDLTESYAVWPDFARGAHQTHPPTDASADTDTPGEAADADADAPVDSHTDTDHPHATEAPDEFDAEDVVEPHDTGAPEVPPVSPWLAGPEGPGADVDDEADDAVVSDKPTLGSLAREIERQSAQSTLSQQVHPSESDTGHGAEPDIHRSAHAAIDALRPMHEQPAPEPVAEDTAAGYVPVEYTDEPTLLDVTIPAEPISPHTGESQAGLTPWFTPELANVDESEDPTVAPGSALPPSSAESAATESVTSRSAATESDAADAAALVQRLHTAPVAGYQLTSRHTFTQDVPARSDDDVDPMVRRFGEGAASPYADGRGPEGYTVMGNTESMLFHTLESPLYRDSPLYRATSSRVWFRDEATATAAGFTHWDRSKRQDTGASLADGIPDFRRPPRDG